MIIENILYINLDSRLDKKKNIENELKSAPINIPKYRISGVIPEEESIKQFWSYQRDISKDRQVLANTAGCYMAHQSAITKIHNIPNKNEKNYSLILEDEINIDEKFWSLILNIQPPKTADIIFFDNLYDPKEDQYDHLYKMPSPNEPNFHLYSGAFCYAVRHNRLKKIIKNLNSKNKTYVDHIDNFLYSRHSIDTYSITTGLIAVNFDFGSDRLSCRTHSEVIQKLDFLRT